MSVHEVKNNSDNSRSKSPLRAVVIIVAMIVVGSIICLCVVCNLIFRIYSDASSKVDNLPGNGVEAAEQAVEFVNESIIGSDGEVVNVNSTPNLVEVVNTYQLSTMKYSYTSILRQYDGDKLLYCVRYEGTIEFLIDMSAIEVSFDETNKVINVILPDFTFERYVDEDLDFIFEDDSYNNRNVGTHVLEECNEDFEDKTPDYMMLDMARETAKNEIRALTTPIVAQYYSDYTLNVDFAYGG